jgi:hypothetical protein
VHILCRACPVSAPCSLRGVPDGTRRAGPGVSA